MLDMSHAGLDHQHGGAWLVNRRGTGLPPGSRASRERSWLAARVGPILQHLCRVALLA
jgi:hypothetical protein